MYFSLLASCSPWCPCALTLTKTTDKRKIITKNDLFIEKKTIKRTCVKITLTLSDFQFYIFHFILMIEDLKRDALSCKEYKGRDIIVYHGDITQVEVDCIVNAANNQLGDGAGINGQICKKGGKDLLAEMKSKKGCFDGEAVMTESYGMPCKKIIHTVGPIYKSNSDVEIESCRCKLSSCYYQSLSLANKNNLCSIGFPCISTGIFHYPLKEATHITINSVLDYFDDHPDSIVKHVLFCVYNDEQTATYLEFIETIFS